MGKREAVIMVCDDCGREVEQQHEAFKRWLFIEGALGFDSAEVGKMIEGRYNYCSTKCLFSAVEGLRNNEVEAGDG